MDTTASTSNTDTWQPAWEREPNISDRLRPFSTAAAVHDGERRQPELWDICNGCILWLPPIAELGTITDPELCKQDLAFFNRPILVLNIEITDPCSATVQFAQLTTLGNQSLEQLEPSRRDHYLPIFPAKPHPHSGILLRLENEAPKRGILAGYVSVHRGVFSLDYRALRCYSAGQKADGYRHRLNEESFNQVARKLGRSPSAWIEKGCLWEEFLRRHVPTGDGRDV